MERGGGGGAEREAARQGGSAEALPGHIIWDRPGYLVRRLHQIHVAMFLEKVARGRVTPIQYGLLSILVSRPNIDQLTIGEELGLDRANVADILKRLEARQLVSRVVDPQNRRRKLCLATARGAALVRQYHIDMKASQQALLAPLSPAERDLFMDLLTRLVEGNNASGRTALRGFARPAPRKTARRAAAR
ncbi:MAG: winged helix-turn-helix transcriptional regulator [Burkholderiales bacterium]|nr:winged helix-turn-helix transcriptional regulator [Burkholderiales bacterium]